MINSRYIWTVCVVLTLFYQTNCECPKIYTRNEWGAREALSVKPLRKDPPPYVVVHHSATHSCFSVENCTKLVRSIQNYHMDNNVWEDIGYNFLIGGDGTIYEGRGYGIHGAHSIPYNARSLGVCLLGNFKGEWNVRAHLDNFLIMIVPTQTVATAASPSLLDFLSKSLPKGSHIKRIKNLKKHPAAELAQESQVLETQHFIESKTAPYHVDLTKPSADIKPTPSDDVVLANSPNLKVIKPETKLKRSTRFARTYIISIPSETDYISKKYAEPKSALRKHKKTIKEKSKAELKLLGAELEQCGPGMVRDSYGVCTVLKH
ncbi:uncharacterized protein [Diabrotica undecimpunctata]|uniref:uncharacterized protein n=1 Tax=Diabrotica undecimpunctata TaxID=50387 RepID=UPI003B632622